MFICKYLSKLNFLFNTDFSVRFQRHFISEFWCMDHLILSSKFKSSNTESLFGILCHETFLRIGLSALRAKKT